MSSASSQDTEESRQRRRARVAAASAGSAVGLLIAVVTILFVLGANATVSRIFDFAPFVLLLTASILYPILERYLK